MLLSAGVAGVTWYFEFNISLHWKILAFAYYYDSIVPVAILAKRTGTAAKSMECRRTGDLAGLTCGRQRQCFWRMYIHCIK